MASFVVIYPNLNVPSSNPLTLKRFSYMYLCLPRFLHPSEIIRTYIHVEKHIDSYMYMYM